MQWMGRGDGITQRLGQPRSGAEVPNRGEAGHQGALGIARPPQRALAAALLGHHTEIRAVEIEVQVDVHGHQEGDGVRLAELAGHVEARLAALKRQEIKLSQNKNRKID